MFYQFVLIPRRFGFLLALHRSWQDNLHSNIQDTSITRHLYISSVDELSFFSLRSFRLNLLYWFNFFLNPYFLLSVNDMAKKFKLYTIFWFHFIPRIHKHNICFSGIKFSLWWLLSFGNLTELYVIYCNLYGVLVARVFRLR